jgi:hypothetical protein
MALSFDGVNDIVNHGNITALNGATVLATSFWFMLGAAPPANADFWSKGETFGVGFPQGVANTKIGAHGALASGQRWFATTDPGLTTGVWYHVAVRYDGSGATNADRLKVILDGSNLALTFSAAVPASLASTTTAFQTGKNQTNNVFINATIAHLKVWVGGTPLTLAELDQERQSFRPVRTANLVLWAPYDDDTSARDYSQSGNHGTVTEAFQTSGPPVSYGG